MNKGSKKPTQPSDSPEEQSAHRDPQPMPSLLFSEVHFDEQETDGPFPEPEAAEEEVSTIHHTLGYRRELGHNGLIATNNPPPPRGAWGYIWGAIAVVMALIIGLWAYALPSQLSLSELKNSSEYTLFKQSQARWDELSEADKTSPATSGTTDTVNNLGAALEALNRTDATLSSTTTLESSTTTAGSNTPSSTRTSSTK